MDINQVEERAPMGTPRNLATIHENFSGFQAAASLQLRNLGRVGVEADVAVWWPLTLRISSERYVARPERSGESAASPKLAAPAWRMPHRSGLKYTKIPAAGDRGKCCQFSNWGAAGTRRLEGGFPSQRPRRSAALLLGRGRARRPAEPRTAVAGRTAVRTAASLYGLSPMSFWRKCRRST